MICFLAQPSFLRISPTLVLCEGTEVSFAVYTILSDVYGRCAVWLHGYRVFHMAGPMHFSLCLALCENILVLLGVQNIESTDLNE